MCELICSIKITLPFLLMTGINDLKKGQSILSISKYTWNKATQTSFYHREITASFGEMQRKQDRKKATLQSIYPPKFPSMGFYACHGSFGEDSATFINCKATCYMFCITCVPEANFSFAT